MKTLHLPKGTGLAARRVPEPLERFLERARVAYHALTVMSRGGAGLPRLEPSFLAGEAVFEALEAALGELPRAGEAEDVPLTELMAGLAHSRIKLHKALGTAERSRLLSTPRESWQAGSPPVPDAEALEGWGDWVIAWARQSAKMLATVPGIDPGRGQAALDGGEALASVLDPSELQELWPEAQKVLAPFCRRMREGIGGLEEVVRQEVERMDPEEIRGELASLDAETLTASLHLLPGEGPQERLERLFKLAPKHVRTISEGFYRLSRNGGTHPVLEQGRPRETEGPVGFEAGLDLWPPPFTADEYARALSGAVAVAKGDDVRRFATDAWTQANGGLAPPFQSGWYGKANKGDRTRIAKLQGEIHERCLSEAPSLVAEMVINGEPTWGESPPKVPIYPYLLAAPKDERLRSAPEGFRLFGKREVDQALGWVRGPDLRSIIQKLARWVDEDDGGMDFDPVPWNRDRSDPFADYLREEPGRRLPPLIRMAAFSDTLSSFLVDYADTLPEAPFLPSDLMAELLALDRSQETRQALLSLMPQVLAAPTEARKGGERRGPEPGGSTPSPSLG